MFTNITGVRVVRLHLKIITTFIYLPYLFLNYILYLINFRHRELL